MKQKDTSMIYLSEVTGEQEFLSGKAEGKAAFQELQQAVDAAPGVAIFTISLKGIQATDASFPRESVISLIKLYSGEKGFCITDFASEDLVDNWDYAAKAKNQAVIVDKGRGKYQVIGPELSDGTRELLDYVMKEGMATTSKVAKKFEISVQNASARMKKLHDMGLVLGSKENAESGGLEYVFRAIQRSA